jgi:hypothetical protein
MGISYLKRELHQPPKSPERGLKKLLYNSKIIILNYSLLLIPPSGDLGGLFKHYVNQIKRRFLAGQ